MIHYESSWYRCCQCCGQTVTETSPDFLDALATGFERTSDRPTRWYTVTTIRDDDGGLVVSYTPHTQGRCSRARRAHDHLQVSA